MIYDIFIVPLIMLICGFLMYKHPPKKINFFVGYRTKKSMKNKINWKKANIYSGKIMLITGIVTTIISIIILILELLNIIRITDEILVVIILIQLLPLSVPIILTEKKLKEKSL